MSNVSTPREEKLIFEDWLEGICLVKLEDGFIAGEVYIKPDEPFFEPTTEQGLTLSCADMLDIISFMKKYAKK